MLEARDRDGQPILSWDALREETYFCPVCCEGLVLKRGPIVIAHFAHHPASSCAYGVGESLRHHQMKAQVGKLFEKGKVRYEVPLRDHRADVMVRSGQTRFVVECQDSALSVSEWMRRTKDYTEIGYPVLWVWDLARIVGPIGKYRSVDSLEDRRYEERIPAEVRLCHKQSYGKVYVLDPDGELRSCHLGAAATRFFDGGPTWDESQYTPRTLKCPRYQSTPLYPTRFRGVDGESLISLGEGVWWK